MFLKENISELVFKSGDPLKKSVDIFLNSTRSAQLRIVENDFKFVSKNADYYASIIK